MSNEGEKSASSVAELEMYSTQGYFPTPSRNGLLQQLSHLVFFGDGVSVVNGSPGSGKTKLLMELKGALQIAPYENYIFLEQETDTASFIEQVVNAFNLGLNKDSQSAGELITELRHFNQALIQENNVAVLVIDNAHFIEEQAVASLLSLFQGLTHSGSGIRVIFFSEDGLTQLIDGLQLFDVSVYDFEVPNFSSSELNEFLIFYAEQNHIEIPDDFSAQKIWSTTKGHAKQSINLAFGELQDPLNELEKEGVNFLPIGHVVAVLLLCGVLSWAFFMRNGDDKAIVVASSLDARERVSDVVSAVDRKVINESHKALNPESVNQEAETESSLNELDLGNSNSDAAKAIDDRGEELSDANSFQFGPVEDQDLNVDELDLALDQAENGVAGSEEPLSDSTSENAEKNQSDPSLVKVNQSDSAPLPSSETEARIIKKEKSLQTTLQLTADESFLMSLPEQQFVLQIVAASKKASLIQFISQQSNKHRLYLYQGERQGKLWYIVVEGPYADKQQALNGRNSLPPKLAKSGPWPRDLKSIHTEIDSAQKLK